MMLNYSIPAYKNRLLALSLIVYSLFICTLPGCGNSEKVSNTGISAIEVASSDIEIELFSCTMSDKCSFTVKAPGSFSIDDIAFVSENTRIAVVHYEELLLTDIVYYTIEAVSPGETYIYFQTSDGLVKSEKIKVTVKQNITDVIFSDDSEITISLEDEPYIGSFTLKSEKAVASLTEVLSFVCENPDIVLFEASGDSNTPAFSITPLKSGTTCIYISTKDGIIQSEKLTVTVKQAKQPATEEATETTTVETVHLITTEPTQAVATEPTQAVDTEPTQAVDTEPTQARQTETTRISQTESEETQPTQTEAESGMTVYITPTGTKYHYSASCAGPNAMERDLDEVTDMYAPCKKCAQ